ncbi:hypothetical protein RchiOBHm_Chr1g0382451 [Rosa chinensis]|uniref:Uncharacterized protein n=1 Tax=Rosa chinensis TaxID=74649 RepID=A0A2P6SPE9_ROSCH|nr:hypothetical protein RchiOBHm_Chr1g0382451 [Rosa chinensis]
MAAIAAEQLVAEELKMGVGGGDYAWKMRRIKQTIEVRVRVFWGKLHRTFCKVGISGMGERIRLWESATKIGRIEEREKEVEVLIILGVEKEREPTQPARERRGGDQMWCNEMSPFISGFYG